MWPTDYVFAKKLTNVADTDYGLLKIWVDQYTPNGEAIFTLKLEGHDACYPLTLTLKKGEYGFQQVLNVESFHVLFLQRDLSLGDRSWGIFTVFTMKKVAY